MSGYKEYYGSGAKIRYFPDTKTMILVPQKNQQDKFNRLRTHLDTLLQIDGQKQEGKNLSLKLNDTFNVNVDELLKSMGMKGGIEREDAASMVDDATKQNQKEEETLQGQNQQVQPQQPQMQQQGLGAMPPPVNPNQQLPEVFNISVESFLFEEFSFDKPKDETRRVGKRFGKYWEPIERFTGKNKNAVKPDDILDLRKKFSIKPESTDRNHMLACLDKAAGYFFEKLEQVKGIEAAQEFDEKYVEIDSLRPEDYEMDDSNRDAIVPQQSQMSLMPNFDIVDYDDVDIEK